MEINFDTEDAKQAFVARRDRTCFCSFIQSNVKSNKYGTWSLNYDKDL